MKSTLLPLPALCGLLLLGMVAATGCVYYQRYPMPKSRLSKIDSESLSFYVIDAAHPMTRAWYVSEVRFQQGQMHGFLSKLTAAEALEVSSIRSRRDARDSRNDVLIYAGPRLLMGMGDTLTTFIPYDKVERVEVHEPNFGKSVGISMLGVAGGVFILSAATSGY